MRSAWRWINRWPHGWWGVPLAMALGFAVSAFMSLVLLDRDLDYALPMAAAVAVGGGLGQALGVLWPRKKRQPAWQATTAPPPGRPD
jgi:hypothetical protein